MVHQFCWLLVGRSGRCIEITLLLGVFIQSCLTAP